MKRCLILLFLILIFLSILTAQTREKPTLTVAKILPETSQISRNGFRNPPVWTWAHQPLNVMESWFDYMPGGYNSIPIQLIPDAQGGGYFMIFHGKNTSSATRRVYYAKISSTGTLAGTGLVSTNTNAEGYPGLDVDEVTGIPFYTWHGNIDADVYSETVSVWDKLTGGSLGIFAPISTVINNPITMPAPYNSTNNAFIWPVVQIGPSPTAGMRRVYIMGRNNFTNNGSGHLSENVNLAYADFSTDMLNNGTALNWSYTTIPLLDAWNHDTTLRRRPATSLCVGNDGRIYVAGYHTTISSYMMNIVNEPELDVFVCDNYGAGTWQRYSAFSHIQCWNPPDDFGTGGPTFNVDEPEYLFWGIHDSGHLNSVWDQEGRLHMAAMWNVTLIYPNGVNEFATSSITQMSSVKEAVFDTNTQEFFLREIYPIAGTASDTLTWLPWDTNADYIVDAYNPLTGSPVIHYDMNYPYWDYTVHGEEMAYQYNNFRITEPNDQGWMACVWQNSLRAYNYNHYNQTEFQAFANVPEIFISVSNDYGVNWSEPIMLNSVEVTALAGNTPMYVYPADKIKNIGLVNGHPYGRLALMYYHDNTWGSYNVTPAVGANDGGFVRYMAIDIDMSSLGGTGVTGLVRRADNQQPLANAVVTDGVESTSTNAQGIYNLYLEPGIYNITASSPGFAPSTATNVSVSEGFTITVDFSLSLGVNVYGYVFRTNPNLPLPGAIVTLTGSANYSTVTDSLGYFIIQGVLPNQAYLYIVQKDGYNLLSGTILVPANGANMGTLYLQSVANEDDTDTVYPDALVGVGPNPFRDITTLSYTLKEAGPVSFEIYNILGQKIHTLQTERSTKGKNSISWDGRDRNGLPVASGVYFCRLRTDHYFGSAKLIRLK